MGQRKQSDLLRYINQLVTPSPEPKTMGQLAGLQAIVDAGGPQTPVPAHVPPQPQTQMRAPTVSERVMDYVRGMYASAAEQPFVRIADAVGMSDIQGVADELGQPNTGLKLGMMPEGPGKALKGIKAFHGSPHDFDAFSLGKIGTGEGAQAYGHGLYFADSEGVARDYRDRLTAQTLDSAGGDAYDYLTAAIGDNAADRVMAAKRNYLKAIGADEDWFTPSDHQKRVLDAIAEMGHAPPGRMYEVSINADPEDFLDWDAPLSQQSEKVRQALGALGVNDVPRGQNALNQIRLKNKEMVSHPDLGPEPVEAHITDAEVSNRLKQAGIPGIKYLDGASRSAGQGSRNYVVFDDKLISIVKKYGIAGALTAGLINQAQAEQLQQEGYE